MLSNVPAICRATCRPGHCQLVYQGLTGEAVPAAFYHFSLHLPSQSKQAPSGLPRFVLAALSLVMNKTRPEGPHPSLFILFPWGSNLSPTWHHQQVPSPLPIPSMIFSTSTAFSSFSPPPTACRSWSNHQQPQ